MRSFIRLRSRSLIAFALGGSLLVPMAGSALAQEESSGQRPPPETRKAGVMRANSYKVILPIQELLAEDKAREALEKLKAVDTEKFNDYEKSVTFQMWGYAYSALENYDKSIEYFEKAIATGELNPNVEQDLRFNTAQMYRALEKLEPSLKRFEEWLARAESPTGTQYYQIASTYYQAEKFDKALPLIEKGIATKPDPEQSWMTLAVALYIDKKDYRKAVPYLEQLATRFPKAAYWKQLAAVYSELKQENKTLAALELAYKQNFLDSNTDLRRLAEMYMYLEVPYKAAVLLDKEINAGRMDKDERNWELLANAWFQAREIDKAFAPLEKAAALSGDGKQYMRLGQLHIEKEKWQDAVSAIEKAVNKGGLKSKGEALLLRGIALFNLGKVGPAKEALASARRSGDASVARQAVQWEKHIETQLAADSAE